MSRAEVARSCGLSAAGGVACGRRALAARGLSRKPAAASPTGGRPATQLRLARAERAGAWRRRGRRPLPGRLRQPRRRAARRADRVAHARIRIAGSSTASPTLTHRLMARPGVTTLGVGISLPGLLDYRIGKAVLSPNIPITDGHSPASDLGEQLGLSCVMLQESHALCLAEQHHGLARGLGDFAMLDVHTGVGLGVVSGGRLLTGHSGLAGEIGHITAVPDGRRCGCGNHGCLETVASDSSLAWRVSRRLGRTVDIDEVIAPGRRRARSTSAPNSTTSAATCRSASPRSSTCSTRPGCSSTAGCSTPTPACSAAMVEQAATRTPAADLRRLPGRPRHRPEAPGRGRRHHPASHQRHRPGTGGQDTLFPVGDFAMRFASP